MTASLTSDILPAGPDGVLVRFALRPDPVAMTAAQVLARSLQDLPPAGVVEIAPGLVSVLLRFDPARTDRARLTARLRPQARCWNITGALRSSCSDPSSSPSGPSARA